MEPDCTAATQASMRLALAISARGAVVYALMVGALLSVYAVEAQSFAVPEYHPGVLAGYLSSEELTNSLALIPPPPALGTAALALDEETSRISAEFLDTPRWTLANEDADLRFPQAVGTFTCALASPVTALDTPHLYMLLRRSLADASLSTYAAKDHYRRTRSFIAHKQPTTRRTNRN